MVVGCALHLRNGAGAEIQLVATDAKERNNWFEALSRKVELLRQADADLEPEPEPEEESPVSVVSQDCLAAGQQHATHAVQQFEHWKRAVDHTALHKETDDQLKRWRDRVKEIADKPRFAEKRSMVDTRTLELRAVERDISDIGAVLKMIHKCIGAERSMRELCPEELLRAMMWGVGEHFPQLSPREVSVTHHRYISAQAGGRAPAPDETLCDGVRRDVGDQTLRQSITGLLSVAEQSQSEEGGLLKFAQLSKQALREELKTLDALAVRARDENMDDRVGSCRQHVDADPPNTDELDRLQAKDLRSQTSRKSRPMP